MKPEFLEALTRAFPESFYELDCSRTLGGYYCLHLPGKGYAWYSPEKNQITKVGNSLFNEERPKLNLLPDPMHGPTFQALLCLLAKWTGTPVESGLRWYPHTQGKEMVGWCLQGRTAPLVFPIKDKDRVLALLNTIARTKCWCARDGRKSCPQHGARWWL